MNLLKKIKPHKNPTKKVTKLESAKREYARNIITKRVHYYAKLHSFEYKRIAIKNQKSRLGSCSSKGNLNFNWQIIKFPNKIRDYVIIHELSHLKEQNHSKNFWKIVECIDPEYKIHHQWIKKNGHKYLKF